MPELTREQFKRLVPSGNPYPETREEFVGTGRKMMELEEQVYLTVISVPSGPNARPCSVQEYLLSIDELAFKGTFQLTNNNAEGKPVVVQRLFENFESREEHDKELLEAILGKENSVGAYWKTAYQNKIQEGQFSQVRIYHLKGGDKP